jgi:metal-responsive CopG/Arc/MetJ family transcriptional regulator
MKNIQISFDETLLEEVDRIAETSRLSRSAIVREALKTWIKQKEIKAFEEQWISKLKESPDDSKDSDAWIQMEPWGEP